MRSLRLALTLAALVPGAAFAADMVSVSGSGTIEGIVAFTFTAQVSSPTHTPQGRVKLTNPPKSDGQTATGVTIEGSVVCATVELSATSGEKRGALVFVNETPSTHFPRGWLGYIYFSDGSPDRLSINTRDPNSDLSVLHLRCSTYDSVAFAPDNLPALTSGDISIRTGEPASSFVARRTRGDYVIIGAGNAKVGSTTVPTVYARTHDWYYAKSVDGMVSWTSMPRLLFNRYVPDGTGCVQQGLPVREIWVTNAGTLLANAGSALYRSTDNGATWESQPVLEFATNGTSDCKYENHLVLMTSGLSQKAGSSTEPIYVVPYVGTIAPYPGNCATAWSNALDGVRQSGGVNAWQAVASIPTKPQGTELDVTCGSLSRTTDAVRHVHGIASLPSGVWLLTGDDGTENGIWRLASGQWQRKSPSQSGGNSQQWRAVSIQERDGHLYWGRDTSGNVWREATVTVTDVASAIVSAPVPTTGELVPAAPLVTFASSVYFSAQVNGKLYFSTTWENGTAEKDDRRVAIWEIDGNNAARQIWTGYVSPSASAASFGKITGLYPLAGSLFFGTENVQAAPAPTAVGLTLP